MRIGFYHETAGTLHASGIAVYIQHMAAELSKHHDVYLYTQRGELSDLVANSDVEVIQLPALYDRIPGAVETVTPLTDEDAVKIATAVWARRNGVVDHIDEHTDLLVTYQFMDDLLLSHLVDVPTAYGYHRVDGVGIGTKSRERFSRTDLILANSRDTARRVNDEFGYEVDAVIEPGVDVDLFRPDADPAFESDVPTVLFAGRFVEAKGIYDLVEAFAALETPAELHVVGRGDDDPIRDACDELGIADSVTVHGEIPHGELPGYYAAADVFCLPSHAESFGMVNLEAMACGTPVVTSDLEAVGEYLSNGENGLLVQSGDPRDIADKLSILLSAPGRRAEMGERARERALDFSWRSQGRRMEQFCAEALGAPGATVSERDRSAHPRPI